MRIAAIPSQNETNARRFDMTTDYSPIERAIRSTLRSGQQLATPTGSPFTLATIDRRAWFCCLADKKPIRVSPGRVLRESEASWMPIGGVYASASTPGTLDAYMKGHIKRKVPHRLSVGYVGEAPL